MLWLDKGNLYAKEKHSEPYLQEFLKFIEIALENKMGLISGKNMSENILKKAQNQHFNIELDIDKFGYKFIIRY